ncbi:MAG: hypothetical protein HY898_26605 [Deltaproteobacteria bacterium]|nr:hypothetical protein [Deltaproteobacteria bacterium]
MVDRRTRVLAMAAFGCAGTVIGYAAVRCLGAVFGDHESPASILWTEHSAFRWSVLIGLWLGGLVAIGGWAWMGRDPLAASVGLRRTVALAFVGIVAQGLLVP